MRLSVMKAFGYALFLLFAAQAPIMAYVGEHPEFTAVPGYKMVHEESAAEDHLLFPTTHWDHHDISGKKIFRQFVFDASLGAPQRPNIGILRHYYDIVRAQHGKAVHKEATFASSQCAVNDVKLAVIVEAYHGGTSYTLSIMEIGKTETVKADQILAKLNAEGHIALYFSFESGEDKPGNDANESLSQIAQMLKANPSMRILIEGHTDNVGTPEKNKSLSKRRADAVKESLVKLGIQGERLDTTGFGQERPISTNSTEDGRVKNRRVELVKVK